MAGFLARAGGLYEENRIDVLCSYPARIDSRRFSMGARGRRWRRTWRRARRRRVWRRRAHGGWRLGAWRRRTSGRDALWRRRALRWGRRLLSGRRGRCLSWRRIWLLSRSEEFLSRLWVWPRIWLRRIWAWTRVGVWLGLWRGLWRRLWVWAVLFAYGCHACAAPGVYSASGHVAAGRYGVPGPTTPQLLVLLSRT